MRIALKGRSLYAGGLKDRFNFILVVKNVSLSFGMNDYLFGKGGCVFGLFVSNICNFMNRLR